MSDEINRAEYYSPEKPEYLQQGGVLIGVPLFMPQTDELYIVRGVDRKPIAEIAVGPSYIELEEQAIEGFSDGKPEFGVVTVTHSAVMIVTPTCDIAKLKVLLVCPVFEFRQKNDYWKQTFELKASSAFPVPSVKDVYDDSYADFTNITVTPNTRLEKSEFRVCIAEAYQHELSAKLCDFLGRPWGFNDKEFAPADGFYRCMRCCQHYPLKLEERKPFECKKGDLFPPCDNCRKINKSPQYRLMTIHKK